MIESNFPSLPAPSYLRPRPAESARWLEEIEGVARATRERGGQGSREAARRRDDERAAARSEQTRTPASGAEQRQAAGRRLPADSGAVSAGPPETTLPPGLVPATFLVQLLGQEGRIIMTERGARLLSDVATERDALAKGSLSYRQAGADPEIYSSAPAVLRLAV